MSLVERAAALSNVMHWAYSVSATVAYGLSSRCSARAGRCGMGPAFRGALWSSDYITLPLAGVYEPIWKYGGTSWRLLSRWLRE